MNSIRIRLIILFIFITTVTLGVFGIYAQKELSKDLEARFAVLQKDAISRFQTNLPAPLWNIDVEVIKRIVAAEMTPQEVRAIYLLDANQAVVVGAIKDKAGQIVPSVLDSVSEGGAVKVNIFPPSAKVPDDAGSMPPMGTLVVYYSRATIDEKLRAAMQRQALQILALDVLLVLALILSLRTVFTPLERLRDALFELAGQEGEDVKELQATKRTEFDAVIKGFNQTLYKLKSVIARRTQAETEARAASEETKQALAELKLTQEELIKSGKMAALGSLVAGISHELNTPIGNGLVAMSTLQGNVLSFKLRLIEKAVSRSSFEAFLVTVEEASDITLRSLERSAELVSSFKEIAMDQSTGHRRRFKLHEVLHDVLTVLHPTLKKACYKVETSVADDIELDSYPGSLAQVLTNLISNAVVHGFDGRPQGLISIQAELGDKGRLLLRVKDDGNGILSQNISRIFDPFFTTKLGKGGSGLGLYISHNVVTQILGGKLNVYSQPGVSTEFEVDLPLSAPSVESAETLTPPERLSEPQ